MNSFHRCPPGCLVCVGTPVGRSTRLVSLLGRWSQPIQSSYFGSKPDPRKCAHVIVGIKVHGLATANRAHVWFHAKSVLGTPRLLPKAPES